MHLEQICLILSMWYFVILNVDTCIRILTVIKAYHGQQIL